jgi:serine/threonine protein phosphatase PrpC
MFAQTGQPCEQVREESQPAMIHRRFHGDDDQEAAGISLAPTMELPVGEAGNGQLGGERTLSLAEGGPHDEPTLSLTVSTLTHPGIARRHRPNEDSLFAAQGLRAQQPQPQPYGLFILADGMGGHAHGQEASRLAIRTLIGRVLPEMAGGIELEDTELGQLLVDGVREANQAVCQRNSQQRTAMGTTLTAALVVGAKAHLVNVGDSRIYLYREGAGLRRLTRDHSIVAYLVETGVIQAAHASSHPGRNQLYRCLGQEQLLVIDVFCEPLQPDDKLLLCSDGLWAMVGDPGLQQILSTTAETSSLSRALLGAALDGGGADNISAIVVEVSQAMRYRDELDLSHRQPQRFSHE